MCGEICTLPALFLKSIFNFSFFATAWLFCLWALASAAGERWAGATTECAVAPPPLCRYRRTEGEPWFWPMCHSA